MANNLKKKISLCVICSSIFTVPLSFADDYQISVEKVTLNKIFTKGGVEPLLQNDGSIYGLYTPFNSNDVTIFKQLPNNKVVTLGNIPHPDITKLDRFSSQNSIIYSANKFGTVVVAYTFFNQQSKYQQVFYKFKNNQWTRLTDLIDKDVISIDKVFIDDNENISFWKRDPFKSYALQNGSWVIMDNLANDSKTEVYREKVFNMDGDTVYTTGITPKPNMFQVYRYNKDIINYSEGIPLGDNEYDPVCTVPFGNNTVLTAFVNNHQNLTNKSIKFQVISLNKKADNLSSSSVNDNSLLGSIFSLGKSVANIAKHDDGAESSVEQPDMIKETSISKYNLTTGEPQCITYGDAGYFLFTAYGRNNSIDYFKFKFSSK